MKSIELNRILLASFAKELTQLKVLNRTLLLPDGDVLLQVDVPGPEDKTADFRLDSNVSHMGDQLTLTGIYTSSFLSEGLVRSWTLRTDDDPAEVAELLIKDFADECAYKEHEQFVQAELVTDVNLEEFLPYLNDFALSTENVYALGIRVPDDGEWVPIGAASFFFTEEDLVIDNIYVVPEFRRKGIATYIQNYIIKTALE